MNHEILPLDPKNAVPIRWNLKRRSAQNCRSGRRRTGVVDLYQVFCAGLNSPGRPVGNLLFLVQPAPARRAL